MVLCGPEPQAVRWYAATPPGALPAPESRTFCFKNSLSWGVGGLGE